MFGYKLLCAYKCSEAKNSAFVTGTAYTSLSVGS